MKKYILLLALAVPLIFGCERDETEAAINFGAGEGITYRNANNVPMAHTDPTDWTTDAQWNDREQALFSLPVAVDLNGPQAGVTTNMSFYPNPLPPDGVGVFNLNSAIEGNLRLIWVDKNYKAVATHEQAISKGTVLQQQFPQTTFPKEQKYRLYYVLYKPDGTLIYKGHGDVHIHQP